MIRFVFHWQLILYLYIVAVYLATSASLQPLHSNDHKQIIQSPTGRRQNIWLFTNVVEELNL